VSKEWFVVHTLSGHENKVCQYIENKLEQNDSGFKDNIFQVRIPTEDVVEMRDGKKKKFKRKYFPGYVLIEMNMNDTTWHLVKDVPGITNFVGQGGLPKAITEKEAGYLFSEKPEKQETQEIVNKINYVINDQVKVIDGPFKNFNGIIEEVNHEKGRLKVRVEIFGRSTPVEVDFLQVERR